MRFDIFKITAFFSCMYLVLSMDTFLSLLIWPPLLNLPVYCCILFCFLNFLSRKKLNLDYNNLLLVIVVFAYMVFFGLPLFHDFSEYPRFISFVPLILIMLLRPKIQIYTFDYLLRFFRFICKASIIVFFVLLFIELPFVHLNSNSFVMEGTNYYYKLYGFILSSTNVTYNVGGLMITRVMGIFLEPGHFATFLGAIALGQKLIYNKTSKVIIIAGVLTFSPVFYVCLLILIAFSFIVDRSKKIIKRSIFVICIVLFGVSFLSQKYLDIIWELAIERNFSDISSVEERLNERADYFAMAHYRNFVKSNEVWVGKGSEFTQNLGMISDYRGLIFRFGIVGFILTLMICLLMFKNSQSLKFSFLFIPFVLLVGIQRSWMFQSTYIFMLLFIFEITYLKTLKDGNKETESKNHNISCYNRNNIGF